MEEEKQDSVEQEKINQTDTTVECLSLWQKIAKARELVGVVKKDGKVSFKQTNYNYQKAEDIELAVRNACEQVGLIIIPKKFNIISDTGSIITTIQEYKIIDIDTGDFETCEMGGMGQDNGDKRIYKAETGCFKYMMKQLFQIPSDNDTDPDIIPTAGYKNPPINKNSNGDVQGSVNWRDYVMKSVAFAGKTLGEMSSTEAGKKHIIFQAGRAGEQQPYCNACKQELGL